MRQMTIFRRQRVGGGVVLDNCSTYSLSPYYYLFFNIYILKPPYINYNILFQIIMYPISQLN
jgi:hypothetical protein